ncbi:LTA synthase family protein [Brotaphodocola sp.]|uniref:LTA synthase family protein n=1 Tax=Brotaphodocola sp. TaxID=3073577 RepID=UPI003D7E0F0F
MSININKEEWKTWGVKLLLIIAISLFLPYTLLSQFFLKPLTDTTILITDIAEKNEKSGGTDVRIKDVLINGKQIPFDDMLQEGEWKFADGVLMTVNPQTPAYISYCTDNIQTLEINFQKHDGSGIVQISINGKEIKKLDLYSPEWDEVHFSYKLKNISIYDHFSIFIELLVVITLLIQMIPYFWRMIKGKDNIKKYILTIVGIYGILIIATKIFRERHLVVECGILVAITIILGGGVLEYFKEKKQKIWFEILKDGFWMLLGSGYIFIATEIVGQNSNGMAEQYVIGNIAIYFSLILIFYILTRTMFVSIMLISIVSYIFAVANYFVQIFRGSPITPGDFLAAGTAKNVFLNYHYEFNWNMFLALWILVIFLIITCQNYGKRRDSLKIVMIWVIPEVILISNIIASTFFKPELDLWNLNHNIEQYGIAMSFVSNVRRMHLQEPEGYFSVTSEEMMREFIEPVGSDKGFHPNIIAIMNESFSDLSVVDPELDNEEYMSYFNSLDGNIVKGKMLVYPIGGGTANTEYEFLTGNSMSFLQGSVPYQQFITRNGTYSIAQILKARGYHTIGIHPYDKTGYNRYQVYPRLGFDEFLDIDDFSNPDLVRDRYISDKTSYEKVIEEFEKNKESNQPVFIFNVTMQNHSSYDTGYFGKQVIQVPNHEGEFPNTEEYLTLIKESDNALPTLLNYFSSVNDPTIIVFFGDHQPMVEMEFYESIVGKKLDDWSMEEVQRRHIVPFFIWANYDIESEQNLFISSNYLSELLFEKAEMNLVPYQEFLKEMRKDIPAMNGNAYLDREGNWHALNGTGYIDPMGEWHAVNEKNLLREEYWKLQYRNMFDKKIHY